MTSHCSETKSTFVLFIARFVFCNESGFKRYIQNCLLFVFTKSNAFKIQMNLGPVGQNARIGEFDKRR